MSIFRDFAKIAAAVAEEALAAGIDAFETKGEQVGRKLDEKANKAADVINAKREKLEDVVSGVITTVDALLTDLEQQFNPRAQQKVQPTTTLDKPTFQAPKQEEAPAAAPAAKEEKAAAPKTAKAAKKPAAPNAAAKKPSAKKKPAAPKAPK